MVGSGRFELPIPKASRSKRDMYTVPSRTHRKPVSIPQLPAFSGDLYSEALSYSLLPQGSRSKVVAWRCSISKLVIYGGCGWIRTTSVSYVTDLQSAAFNQFGTHIQRETPGHLRVAILDTLWKGHCHRKLLDCL